MVLAYGIRTNTRNCQRWSLCWLINSFPNVWMVELTPLTICFARSHQFSSWKNRYKSINYVLISWTMVVLSQLISSTPLRSRHNDLHGRIEKKQEYIEALRATIREQKRISDEIKLLLAEIDEYKSYIQIQQDKKCLILKMKLLKIGRFVLFRKKSKLHPHFE